MLRGQVPTCYGYALTFIVTCSGYPFLGNDFFAEMGDVFACHAIDNPDQSSEMDMLKAYAPDLDVGTIMSLSTAFMDLRAMQDTGELLYPYVAWQTFLSRCLYHTVYNHVKLIGGLGRRARYSTRELVNIVRHMTAYPEDSMEKVLANVLSFDSFDEKLLVKLKETFATHGLL